MPYVPVGPSARRKDILSRNNLTHLAARRETLEGKMTSTCIVEY